ncbi:hypothetical protein [Streptomyces sp. NPDC049585]|uniref:hypothetical protein n=1 Tax=Streptomyces sp. NPDC049585 TaxID=3155154 RepID=UPI003412C1B2
MSQQEWDRLTASEQAFMVNTYESDVLAGVWGDLDEADQALPAGHERVTGILLSLVDRGWVEVRRGAERIPRDRLASVLAEPAEWEYPEDDWSSALTLVTTDAGRRITHRSE